MPAPPVTLSRDGCARRALLRRDRRWMNSRVYIVGLELVRVALTIAVALD